MNFETNGRFQRARIMSLKVGGWAVDFIIYQVEKICCLRQGKEEHNGINCFLSKYSYFYSAVFVLDFYEEQVYVKF